MKKLALFIKEPKRKKKKERLIAFYTAQLGFSTLKKKKKIFELIPTVGRETLFPL